MKRFNVITASVGELVARFLELSIEQDEMEMAGKTSRANAAIRARFSLQDELRRRDGDARRLLVRFYEHQNIQVQCNAASATLTLFPKEARRKLEQISSWKLGAPSLDAGMQLWMIDTGRAVPK